jgi:hypothetical protein
MKVHYYVKKYTTAPNPEPDESIQISHIILRPILNLSLSPMYVFVSQVLPFLKRFRINFSV